MLQRGGRKPKSVALRLITGGVVKENPRLTRAEALKNMVNDPATGRPDLKFHGGRLDRRGRQIWTAALPRLPWLRWVDGFLFTTWCEMQARIEAAEGVVPTAYLAECRRTADTLGIELDKSHLSEVKPAADPGEAFFK